MSQVDAAESSRLSEAVERISTALDEFNRFQDPDTGAQRKPVWEAVLDEPLPEQGVGLDPVLRQLSETCLLYTSPSPRDRS